ncbi:CrcB family protein [uncultured Microbacterium sp.]|uniref:fluoride efflux transporter FluC n=1 Tax=uncultured Microbacterium sp. TaxID=191216 RepID=UPI0028DD2204|nr:CrcB family protein [uncultured Microbacterium sp.]
MTLRRLLLVMAGGTIGTAARLGLGLVLPDRGFPWAIFAANVVGALLIGIVAARFPSTADVRLFLATGVLGGFTTYSAFMTGTLELWTEAPPVAFAYAAASLVLGLAAAVLGLRIGRPHRATGTGA